LGEWNKIRNKIRDSLVTPLSHASGNERNKKKKKWKPGGEPDAGIHFMMRDRDRRECIACGALRNGRYHQVT